MAVATSHYWRCLAETDGEVCGKVFYDKTDRLPCPDCGNGEDALLEGVTIEEAEEEKRASAARAKATKPAPAPKAAPKSTARTPSALFRRASVERSRIGVERITALGVLLVSLLGTVVAFHGGWDALLSDVRWIPSLLALIVQGGLTYVQWAYYRHRTIAWGSRLVDTFLTALGYGPLLLVPLSELFWAAGITSVVWGWPGALVAAATAISIASYGLAWYPESRLVD